MQSLDEQVGYFTEIEGFESLRLSAIVRHEGVGKKIVRLYSSIIRK